MWIQVVATIVVVALAVVGGRWLLREDALSWLRRHEGARRVRRGWRWLRHPADGGQTVPALFADIVAVYRKAALSLPDGSQHGPQGVAVVVGDGLLAQVKAVSPKLRQALYRSAKEAGIVAPVNLALRVDHDPTLPGDWWTVKVWYGPEDIPVEPTAAGSDILNDLEPDPFAATGQPAGDRPLTIDERTDHDRGLARVPTDWDPVSEATEADAVRGAVELIVEVPDNQRIELFSTMTELSIGRGANCDVRILNRTVSRDHARLRRDATGAWWIAVCATATNPVRVDGQPVPVGQPRSIRDGSQMQLSNAVALHVTRPGSMEVA